ncbi:MAG TPA: GMP synthase [Gammaproteobacteria bacterium]|nr:GMP synthase [Gammaproteobacteria bacterium]
MKNYAVIQHNYSEFLGQIERQLEIRDIGFSYFRPFVGQDLPGSAIHFDALFILGGSSLVNDEQQTPWVESEKRVIRLFQAARRPVVGIGFGAMLIAESLGAIMNKEPYHNAYWTIAHKTKAGEGDALAEAVDGKRVLVFANGSATLPDNIEPIVIDDNGNWLAIRPDSMTYGMLFRPELKPGMIEDMIMEADRETPDNIGDLLAEARQEWADTQKTTDAIIMALVKSLDLMKERHKAPVFKLNVES